MSNFLQLQIFIYEDYRNEKKNKDAIYVAYNMCLDYDIFVFKWS